MRADLGTEAIGPSGEKLLPVFYLGGIVFSRDKAFAQGLGGGHGLAGAQAERPGRAIDRLQRAALGRAGQQRQRLIGIGALTQDRVQRQLRKKNADPAHGNLNVPWQRQSAPYGPVRPDTSIPATAQAWRRWQCAGPPAKD